MNPQQIEQVAKDYMRQLGYCENSVSKLSVGFRRKRSNLGVAYIHSKKIIFNSKLLETFSDDEWYGLIAHEVAHFKARGGHNKRFREVLAMLNQGSLTQYSSRWRCSIQDAITAGIEQTFEGSP